MISVDRVQNDEGGTLIAPDEAWSTSAQGADQKVRAEYDLAGNSKGLKFNSNVYGSEKVRAPLEKLFAGKCAYCESSVERFDVDHYRPKGRVAEEPDHPGYYWLAYTWENLLPSCALCNQNRRDQPTWDDPTLDSAAGKYDQFPLEEGSVRVSTPEGRLEEERPLLLNPCTDEPSEHFSCNYYTGELLPRNGSVRAVKTIEVLNLNRKRLREKRKDVGRRLRGFLTGHQDWGAKQEADLESQFTDSRMPFAGFARILVSDPALMDIELPA